MTKRFELWKWYDRQDGKRVQVVEVVKNDWFDGVRCSDGADCESRNQGPVSRETDGLGGATLGWRYNRESDRGRCTGSAHDFSDPFNLIPELDPTYNRFLQETGGDGYLVDVHFRLSTIDSGVKSS